MRDPKRVAILISGRGSNMRALVENAANYEVALVASNKPEAAGLEWARERGLQTWALDSKGVEKEAFDRMLSAALDSHRVGTIALAGFMRILSPWFVEEWRGRIVNIHPSLLPEISRPGHACAGDRGRRLDQRLLGPRRHRGARRRRSARPGRSARSSQATRRRRSSSAFSRRNMPYTRAS